MSIGQRIEQKRRELGWSQEDLGYRLNVSRQSVYKWEADQSMPELDKIITLCQLFDVSIDWLLNGENAEAKAESPDKIIIREKGTSRIYKVMLVVLTIALIVGIVRIRNIERSYTSLMNSIESVRRDTHDSIVGISESIRRTLDSYSNAILNYDIDFVSVDYSSETLTFSLNVVPKVYTEGMSVKVQITSVDDEGKSFVSDALAQEQGEGIFNVSLNSRLTDDISIMCILVNGNVRENVMLYNLYGLRTESFEPYHFGWPSLDMDLSSGRNKFIKNYCSVNKPDGELVYYIGGKFELTGVETAALEVSLYVKDGEKVCTYKQLEGKPDKLFTNETNVVYFERPENLSLDPEKEYKEVLTITDIYGRKLNVETY